MLAERLAVVAEDDEQRLLLQAAHAQAVQQFAQSRVGIVQGIAVAVDIAGVGEGTTFWRLVGMMAGNRQITDEEMLARWAFIDPAKDTPHRGGFINAEAGITVAADGPGVLERIVTTVLDGRIHAQIHEPA